MARQLLVVGFSGILNLPRPQTEQGILLVKTYPLVFPYSSPTSSFVLTPRIKMLFSAPIGQSILHMIISTDF